MPLRTILRLLPSLLINVAVAAGEDPIRVFVNWGSPVTVLKTVPTAFVQPEPPGKAGSDEGLRQIGALGARHIRYAAFATPYRKLIPAMRPPTKESTSWDFTLMDAVTVPFLEIVRGSEPVYCLPVMPPWMFESYDPQAFEKEGVLYGTTSVELDALTITELKAVYTELHSTSKLVDTTGEQLAEYYARIVSWYTQGGFVDENGCYHRSGHYFHIPWIEVMNEVQWLMTAEEYVVLYDAIVSAIRKVSPSTRFIGLGLGPVGLSGSEGPARDSNIKYFEHFLNPRHHRPGIPLDMVSYHFYAVPALPETIDNWQYSIFGQGDAFLNTVAFMEAIRKRLSPSTMVNISELGIILPHDFAALTAILTDSPHAASEISKSQSRISPAYWNLNAAFFAYLYVGLAKQGIDVMTASELMIGNSRAYPSINLVDPVSGKPNARLPALKLLIENFGPGDHLVQTRFDHVNSVPPDVAVQAFDTAHGRKLLVINKRLRPAALDLSSLGLLQHMEVVDEASGGGPPRREAIAGTTVHLDSFAVAVITLEAQ